MEQKIIFATKLKNTGLLSKCEHIYKNPGIKHGKSIDKCAFLKKKNLIITYLCLRFLYSYQ